MPLAVFLDAFGQDFHAYRAPVFLLFHCRKNSFRGVRLLLSARILAYHWVGDGGFQCPDAIPFAWRADIAAGADLVQSPVNFQAMAIGIKKLYRDLTTGPAAPF